MEIIKQIRKQKGEISRIVRDVRTVQVEINATADKLQRTLALAGETMERAATENAKDVAYRQVLRQMITLQELFAQLIAATTTLGHTEAEIRALESRADQLTARNDAGSIAELQRDMQLVRDENAVLAAEVGV